MLKINDTILVKVAEKSLQNAESLISDADLLKENKRYQRAYALYQFAMEEVGKAISSVLLLITINPSQKDFKEYSEEFVAHRKKIKRSSALDAFICKVVYKGNYEGAMSFLESTISEDEKKLDEYKNKSLYTEIIGDDVKSPAEMMGQKGVNYIWLRALSRFKMAQPFVKMCLEHYITLREYQKEHGSIKDMKIDDERMAKEFWDELLLPD